MKKVMRERECIHRDRGAEGEFYTGVFYVQALRRLQVDAAVQIANRISPFFWVDAPHILVWLCRPCAAELGLEATPRSLVQVARRQA